MKEIKSYVCNLRLTSRDLAVFYNFWSQKWIPPTSPYEKISSVGTPWNRMVPPSQILTLSLLPPKNGGNLKQNLIVITPEKCMKTSFKYRTRAISSRDCIFHFRWFNCMHQLADCPNSCSCSSFNLSSSNPTELWKCKTNYPNLMQPLSTM